MKDGLEKPLDENGAVDEFQWRKLLEDIDLPWSARKKIEARAEAISRRHEAQNGLGHLKPVEREKLEVLREEVELAAIPTEHRADALAPALHAEFLGMTPATEVVWPAMRRSARSGEPGLRLLPLLLDGPSGIGKSHWARHLGTLLSVPTMVFEATTENASFGLVSSQRGWGNATPGRLINTILQHCIGNPGGEVGSSNFDQGTGVHPAGIPAAAVEADQCQGMELPVLRSEVRHGLGDMSADLQQLRSAARTAPQSLPSDPPSRAVARGDTRFRPASGNAARPVGAVNQCNHRGSAARFQAGADRPAHRHSTA